MCFRDKTLEIFSFSFDGKFDRFFFLTRGRHVYWFPRTHTKKPLLHTHTQLAVASITVHISAATPNHHHHHHHPLTRALFLHTIKSNSLYWARRGAAKACGTMAFSIIMAYHRPVYVFSFQHLWVFLAATHTHTHKQDFRSGSFFMLFMTWVNKTSLYQKCWRIRFAALVGPRQQHHIS